LSAAAAHGACAAAESAADAVSACTEAALSGDVEERLLALHALAEAHAALGQDDAASSSYLRLLVLSGTAQPRPGASERARRAFAVAKNRVLVDAPVSVRATASSADSMLFDLVIKDPEHRLVALRALGSDGEEQEVTLTRESDGWRAALSVAPFLGHNDRVAVTLEGTGWDGGPVSDAPLAVLLWPEDERRPRGPLRPVGGAILVGTGAVALLLGVGTVATWGSAAAEAAQLTSEGKALPACLGWCVGEKPYVLGVSGESRQALVDGGANGWILAGGAVAITGALLASAGVVLLVTGDE
jgi:hypothetical protein